jgi:hypothetical protein
MTEDGLVINQPPEPNAGTESMSETEHTTETRIFVAIARIEEQMDGLSKGVDGINEKLTNGMSEQMAVHHTIIEELQRKLRFWSAVLVIVATGVTVPMIINILEALPD